MFLVQIRILDHFQYSNFLEVLLYAQIQPAMSTIWKKIRLFAWSTYIVVKVKMEWVEQTWRTDGLSAKWTPGIDSAVLKNPILTPRMTKLLKAKNSIFCRFRDPKNGFSQISRKRKVVALWNLDAYPLMWWFWSFCTTYWALYDLPKLRYDMRLGEKWAWPATPFPKGVEFVNFYQLLYTPSRDILSTQTFVRNLFTDLLLFHW